MNLTLACERYLIVRQAWLHLFFFSFVVFCIQGSGRSRVTRHALLTTLVAVFVFSGSMFSGSMNVLVAG